MGKDLIRLLLGAKWDAAGQIFTFFGPGIGIMLVYSTSGLIHLSIGRADRWFRWVVLEFGVTVLLFFMGLHWGPIGVAAAWTASFWILTIPAFWYAGKPIQFGIAPVLATVWRYVVASLVAGCATAAVIRQIPALLAVPGIPGAFARIVVASVLLSVLYLAAVILLHGGAEPLHRFARLLPDVVPWAGHSKSLPVTEAEVASPLSTQPDSSPAPTSRTWSGTSAIELDVTRLHRTESLPGSNSSENSRT
jgi:hypothetical protein